MVRKLADFYRSTLGHATVGAALLWAALPPLDLWPLAWFAPLWWVLLIRRKQLPGRRPYRTLWVVGLCFWMAALHFLRLPHWATCFGWIALSFYQAFYLPVFVGLGRVAVHRLRVPVILAAPVVWTGLELARAHLLTGITMASLGHTQYRWIELIQISDLAGAFGVSFLVMFVAACFARIVPCDDGPRAFWPLVPAAALLAATLTYGYVRTSGEYTAPGARIALIQGSIDSQMKAKEGTRDLIHEHYRQLSQEAVDRYDRLDLIVWPETMFRDPLITYDPDARKPEDEHYEDWTNGQFQEALALAAANSRREMTELAEQFGTPLILGIDRHHFGAAALQRFNSSVHVARNGDLLGYYDKIHRVMFGEYVPFAEHWSWLHRLTPLPFSLSAGRQPVAYDIGKLRIAANICYESVLSHVIRRQVNLLQTEGVEPDVLVNLTNDGWFWGSSELDMHLICGVFRAVECRKPLLIAANTGFSAWIDGDGRILRQGPRRTTDTLLAEVRLDRRGSWYLCYGDWPAAMCLVACGVFGAIGLRERMSHTRHSGGIKRNST